MSDAGHGITSAVKPALEVLDNEAALDLAAGHLALLFGISPVEARRRFEGVCERVKAAQWLDVYQDIVLGDLTLWAEMLGVRCDESSILDAGGVPYAIPVGDEAESDGAGYVNVEARACDEDNLPEM